MEEARQQPRQGQRRPRQSVEDVQRLRLIKRAHQLFAHLHDAGVERDKAGNRTLLYSHYASLVLLSIFNPAMQSLRGLEQASKLKKVQQKLGMGKTSLGSLSESCRVFDPDLLAPIFEQLLQELPAHHPGPGPRRSISQSIPQELAEKLRVVDGSTLRVLPQIVQSVAEGSWKIHLQFRPLAGLPSTVTLAPEYAVDERDVLPQIVQSVAEGSWKIHLQFRPLAGLPSTVTLAPEYAVDEREVLAQHLEADCVYMGDLGYERYALFNQIVAAGSNYLIRGQVNRPAEVVEQRPLSEAARAARVISDEIVVLGSSKVAPGVARLDHPVRRIVIKKRPQGRKRSDRPNQDHIILLTDLVDLPAEVIGALYELRWCIELFFRFLKQMLGCRRLFSTKQEGIEIQVYCALIACLLLARVTGRRVTMRDYRLICFYLQGWADDEELLNSLKLKEKEP